MTNGTQKKGLPTLAWVGIGCGVLLLLGAISFAVAVGFGIRKVKQVAGDVAADFEKNPAKAAAELAVRLNPDLELVESDDDAGTMTIRNKKDGEVVTLDFKDIADGNFRVTTKDGETSLSVGGDEGVTVRGPDGEARFGGSGDLSDVPDWVPIYPAATGATGAYSGTSGGRTSGAVTAKATGEPKAVLDYYAGVLEERGYEVSSHTMDIGAVGPKGMVNGEIKGERTVNVTVSRDSEGQLELMIVYEGPVS